MGVSTLMHPKGLLNLGGRVKMTLRIPPTNVVQVQLCVDNNVGFTPLLWALQFSSLLKIQHFQSPVNLDIEDQHINLIGLTWLLFQIYVL